MLKTIYRTSLLRKWLLTPIIGSLALTLSAMPIILKAQADTDQVVLYDVIYVFGDSGSDIGNNLILTGVVPPSGQIAPSPPFPSNFPLPVTFFQGRFSNGPVWVEYLSASQGITLRPSLGGFSLTSSDSVNFAYGGSGTTLNNPLPAPFVVEGLLGQINSFIEALEGAPADSNALYILWSGANNYIFPIALDFQVLSPDPMLATADIKAGIEQLADLGAVNFLIANLPDLGNIPLSMNPAVPSLSGLLTDATEAHNRLLVTALEDIAAADPDVNIQLLDTFSLLQTVLADPEALGFPPIPDVFFPGPAADCLLRLDGDITLCPEPDFNTSVLFWDEQHATTAMHKLIAEDAAASLNLAQRIIIDIKPKRDRNRINLRSNGFVKVAILSTSTNAGEAVDFAIDDVAIRSMRFGPAAAPPRLAKIRDIDRDGDDDLLLYFRIRKTGIECGDETALLQGLTQSGQPIAGIDNIITKGCRN